MHLVTLIDILSDARDRGDREIERERGERERGERERERKKERKSNKTKTTVWPSD